MGSRPRLVAESFSRLPSALNTWEINGTAGAAPDEGCSKDGQR